jgi:high-affinity iron transporter
MTVLRSFLCLLVLIGSARADLLDENAALQQTLNGVILDAIGDRWSQESANSLAEAHQRFLSVLTAPAARKIWEAPFDNSDATSTAMAAYALQARLQHVAALEMLYAMESGNIEKAQQWRAIIKLPRYASAVAGALALQQLGGDPRQRREVAKLLSKEFLQWQITRSREKTDELIRLVASDRHSPVLVAARVAEIQELVNLPEPLFSLIEKSVPPRPATGVSELLGSQNLASASPLGVSNSKQLTPTCSPRKMSLNVNVSCSNSFA